MKFFTEFERPEMCGEVLTDEVMVERSGYIPADQQILSMMEAGQRLGDYRRERYDYGPDDEDDGFIDPTRQGLDLAEGQAIQEQVNARLNDQAKAAKAKKDSVAEAERKSKEVVPIVPAPNVE